MNILGNEFVQDVEAIHCILLAEANQFRKGIVERPTIHELKDNPKLYYGEKLLLAAVDLAKKLLTLKSPLKGWLQVNSFSRYAINISLLKITTRKFCNFN